ncbi:MAG: L,D-transpeptidase family protein [Rhizobiaceae bacterium]|nr:L,D-transpeptidase family protein [Rhizobiaceae bacterium]
MSRFIKSLFALSLGAAVIAPEVAQAQGLLEALFGHSKRRAMENSAFPPAPMTPKRVAKPAKISAPSYYDYRADSLVRVDFSSLTTLAPATDGESNAFRDDLAALASVDLRAEKQVASALVEHYAQQPDFLWISDGSPNQRAKDALAVLADADSYGLNAADYEVQPLASASPDDMMAFEMNLSARVLRYAMDAHGGRVIPNRISGYYDFPAKPVDLTGLLAQSAHSDDVRAMLEAQHPQNPQYRALRDELAALRQAQEDDVVVDPDLLLKPGQSSAELPKLIHLVAGRLDDDSGGDFGEVLYRLGESETYTDELVTVFRAEQERAGLKPDGVIGPRTVKAIAGTSKTEKLQKVLVALEQLRWLPSEFGSPRVWINQPAYTASFIEGETPVLSMRAVVGKATNQTSFFYDEIEQIDYNPYWGVPQSIIVNEMLPRLRSDPGYLDRSGYEVFDQKGKRVPSSAVDWGAYGSKVPYAVRQAPSEANALGELKILFPNKHAIYMHDTPQKQFFDRDMRALSHGCIRLQDPRGMAAAVLGTNRDYIAGKLAQGHSVEKTPKIPVYVSYFTAWPTESGAVEYFPDVYKRDDRLRAALSATEAVRSQAHAVAQSDG